MGLHREETKAWGREGAGRAAGCGRCAVRQFICVPDKQRVAVVVSNRNTQARGSVMEEKCNYCRRTRNSFRGDGAKVPPSSNSTVNCAKLTTPIHFGCARLLLRLGLQEWGWEGGGSF